MFKVAIIGGETSGNYKMFATKCIYYLKNKAGEGITILSLGDNYINAFAKATNIDVKEYFVDWGKFGKNALKIRAHFIIGECDALILFDNGTKEFNMYKKIATEAKIPLRVVSINED